MTVIDEYLGRLKKPQREELTRIREIVKKTVPKSEEAISYGIPTFLYKNKYLVGLAAFKKHMSIFPETGPIEAFKFKLKAYKLSRGTIQFTLDNPLDESLIVEIIEYNVAKIDRLEVAKEAP